jgi:sterol 14alpha-demethylase
MAQSSAFKGSKGIFDVGSTMAEITIYTASRSLQGKEVRKRFDSSFADLYHDLDMGFAPINFMLPRAPLPHNRRRDRAQQKMAQTYMDIIKERREAGAQEIKEEDMIWNLMSCVYKDGTPVPDKEVAHMMIALLMAGQHSSSSSSAWIVLRLATRPDIQDELLAEQKRVLGDHLPPLTYDDLPNLRLHAQVVKETLRLHGPIHTIMRKVKSPMPISVASPVGATYTIPTTHNLLAAPGFASRTSEHFPDPMLWEPHRWDEGSPLAPNIASKDATTSDADQMIDYGYGMVSKGANSPYLPFGAGRHRCIGEQFAYVQLETIVANLVRVLRFANLEGRDGALPATDYSSLFSRPMAPNPLRWERRAGMEKEK